MLQCANVKAVADAGQPSLRSVLLLSLVSGVVFVTVISFWRDYFVIMDSSGDRLAYMSVASAIKGWSFEGVEVKHFWGLPYLMAAVSRLTGASVRAALLMISFGASLGSVALAHRLWGGWSAGYFAVLNFDWLQRSFLGGSEPLFVLLLFGAFFAVRKNQWLLAGLLASFSTVVRPVGLLALIAIGVTLLWRREVRSLTLVTLIALTVGGLYVAPLMIYFGSPLANVSTYQTDWDQGFPVGWPFQAIVNGTVLYSAPWSNLLLTYGWIIFVLLGAISMVATRSFRQFAQTHPVEALFTAIYFVFLYTYNSSFWARVTFARFALPVLPITLLALDRWIPKKPLVLWIVAIVSSMLAAVSAIGIRNLSLPNVAGD
jgi:hypothetical protein